MLLKHDCVHTNGLGDSQKRWHMLQQQFQNEERVTMVSVMRQLARL